MALWYVIKKSSKCMLTQNIWMALDNILKIQFTVYNNHYLQFTQQIVMSFDAID